MIRRVFAVILMCLLVGSAALYAQQSQGTVGQLYRLEAVPGHGAQLEEGMKRHMGFHKASGDPWQWRTWSLMAGPYTGQYWVFTGNHNWADFDNDPIPTDDDAADNQATMGPHVGAQNMELLDLSAAHSIVDPDAEPHLIMVNEYRLAPSGMRAFMASLKEVTDTLRAANKDFYHATYVMAAGANGPKVYITFPRDNWAAFESREGEFAQAMTAAHGEEGFGKIMEALLGPIRRVDTHVAQFRAELSSVPAGN